ncbi:MAG: response regulator [Geobacter sp.]|nr:response regulator [Geobacter sp.]
MIDPTLKSYTEQLSVLYVEDDPVSSAIIRKMLERIFNRVYGASDGVEGLQQFQTHQPDLVVTDLMMPNMDGISMLREIRIHNQKVPVVLMTASLEHADLVEAINLGVSKFLAKPLRSDAVQRALMGVTRELHLERVAEDARRQEVELLRYRNRYHSLQEELAKAKERHIVRNQFAGEYLPVDGQGGWLLDLLQQPRDIMSGDSYAAMMHVDNRIVIFLSDAMGHGLSAAVTSMLTTSFFNHFFSSACCAPYRFDVLTERTIGFAAQNLLEDEVFSCLLMELDPVQQRARLLCCGMPALLLKRNGRVERLPGANPPVCSFSPPLVYQEIDLQGVSDILLATDGLGDAQLRYGGSYRDRLIDDFGSTATAAQLFQQYALQCDDDQNDDDITLLRLLYAGGSDETTRYRLGAAPTMQGISSLQQQVIELLEGAGLAGERLDALELALSEALLNAFEHGFLRMGDAKQRLLLEGEYDELITAASPRSGEEIGLTLTLVPSGTLLLVWCEISDPGPGFDAEQIRNRRVRNNAPSGRGIKVMERSVDLVRHSPSGNRVLLLQTFDDESLKRRN